jgi:hypothetical protein
MAPYIIAHLVRGWVCAPESQPVPGSAAGSARPVPQGAAMSPQPERPAPAPSAPPSDPPSAAPAPSVTRRDAVPIASARSALSECVGALSLVQVTVHSLAAQDLACAEQEVLTRAVQALWSLHDWLHDRMWLETEAERAREREGQA